MKCYKLFTVLLSLYVAGCSAFNDSNVEVGSAKFVHPDEVIRGESFLILADRRVFTIMTFMNAMGYDNEWEGVKMHPVRVKVRQMVESRLAKHPKKKSEWQKYYDEMGLEVYHYADFALSLSSDYPFRRIRPDSE